jgi:hypothetical protein
VAQQQTSHRSASTSAIKSPMEWTPSHPQTRWEMLHSTSTLIPNVRLPCTPHPTPTAVGFDEHVCHVPPESLAGPS